VLAKIRSHQHDFSEPGGCRGNRLAIRSG
jgi:hypothetical protein